MAKQTFMAKVKAYRKLHPRTSQVDAMKKLAAKKPVIKKKAVGSAKKAKKKSIIKTERITTIGRAKKQPGPSMATAANLSNRIDDLESLLKKTRGVDAKNKVKRLINSYHDKIDIILKNHRSAS